LPLAEAEKRYRLIAKTLAGKPGVTNQEGSGRKGFGSSGQLKVNDRIFAMLVRGDLVVKLPRTRVDSLVTSRSGRRFDPRRDGRLMKEWLAVSVGSQADWLGLAREALDFVASRK
jgi:hypothetical protein